MEREGENLKEQEGARRKILCDRNSETDTDTDTDTDKETDSLTPTRKD